MISYLAGKIIFKGEKFIILDVKGVGFKIFLAQKVLNKIPQKKEDLNPHTKREQGTKGAKIGAASSYYGGGVKLFCYLNVRERAFELYGFLTQKELESFETLIELPSIGPKAALEISSLGSIEKIKEALEKEDEKVIKEIFSIGKKKAQIIILELSRKIKAPPEEKKISEDEAFQALVNLGFSRQRIKDALAKLPKEIQETEKKVKEALKLLTK
jgi:Holliday junction DNA helicase RuvA